VLAVAAVALSVLVVLLAIQNRSLKRELQDDRGAGARPTLAVGHTVDALRVLDAGGTAHTLDWTVTRRTVVVAYTTTCPACAETLPRWASLAERISERGDVRMLGLELDRPAPGEGPPPAGLPGVAPYPVYGVAVEPNRAFLDLVPYVPATLVIDARGRVLAARFGVLDEDDVDAIAAALEP
jgi:peroxiredoxin